MAHALTFKMTMNANALPNMMDDTVNGLKMTAKIGILNVKCSMLVEFKSRKIHLDPAKLRLAFAETMGHALRAALINSTANVKLVTRANSVKII